MDKIFRWILLVSLCIPIAMFLYRIIRMLSNTYLNEIKKEKESKVK